MMATVRALMATALGLLTGALMAGQITGYDSGVAPTAGASGAADPTTQGWAESSGFGTNQYADGYDSSNGGWRIVDGTSSLPAFYQQNFSAGDLALMDTNGWRLDLSLSLDSDAIGSGGGFVDDYYLPPNHGRQKDMTAWLETTGGKSYIVQFQVDGSSNLLANDQTTSHQLTTDGSAYDNFKDISITYDANAATATLSHNGNDVVLAEVGAHGSNRLVFGASSSSTQGSAIWNNVELSQNLPETPAAAGSLYAWYRADMGVRNGTGDPAADGESLGEWKDVSGNERHLDRIAGTAPTFNASGMNGQPIVDFGGNGGIWDDSGSWGILTQPTSVFVVGRVNEGGVGDYLFDSSSAAGRNALFAGQTGNLTDWQLFAGGVLDSVPFDFDSFFIHEAVFDGTNSAHYLNGLLVAEGDVGAQSLAGLILGSRYSGSQYLDGAIAELLVYDGLLNHDQRFAVLHYLGDKYGVNVVPEPASLALLALAGLALMGRRRR